MVYRTFCRVVRPAGIGVLSITVTIAFIHLLFIGGNSITIEPAYAKEQTTILPDAHSNTAVRFVDVKHYFLPVGEELTWFNDDFVNHILELMNEDNSTQMAVLDLPSNKSASFKFQQPGKFYYSSRNYPKIEGSVDVLDPDKISIERITGLKNGVDVQLAWTPSKTDFASNEGAGVEGTDFVITFIHNKTGTTQEHIDYEFTVSNASGNILFSRASHSTYGIEEVTHNFDKPRLSSYDAQIMITQILFAPVDPDVAQFEKIMSVS